MASKLTPRISARQVVAVVVEASFADADDLWRARQLGDSAEVSIRSLGGQVGVDADRRAGPADLARLEDRGAAAREVIPDEHQSRDAGVPGSSEHLVAVTVE